MRVSRCKVLVTGLNLILLALCLWPMFVVISAAVGHFFADGELLSNFRNEPKRLMVAGFFDGFIRTLPYVTALAFTAVFFQWLLRRKFLAQLIAGIVLVIVLPAAVLFFIPATLINGLVFFTLGLGFLCLYVLGGYLLSRCDHV